jgi:hypothetical protein
VSLPDITVLRELLSDSFNLATSADGFLVTGMVFRTELFLTEITTGTPELPIKDE